MTSVMRAAAGLLKNKSLEAPMSSAIRLCFSNDGLEYSRFLMARVRHTTTAAADHGLRVAMLHGNVEIFYNEIYI